MFEINRTWNSTGSSGGLEPVHVQAGAVQSVLYCQSSTLATTNSFSFQTAQESSGPWFVEASTAMVIAGSQAALRLTGPYIWMRPYLHATSTGTFQFRLIAIGGE